MFYLAYDTSITNLFIESLNFLLKTNSRKFQEAAEF